MSKLKDIDIEILTTFADNDMCICATAKAIHLHHNTIAYHLHKIEKETGLNPYHFWDLTKLLVRLKNNGNLL